MSQMSKNGVVLSSEILAFVAQKASEIHHGRLVLEINVDNPRKVDVFVEQRERFAVSHRSDG